MDTLKNTYTNLANEYVNEIKRVLRKRLISVCLFGSVARGDFTQESDIDLLIVAKKVPKDVGRRHSLLTEARIRILSSDTVQSLRKMGYHPTFSEVILTPYEVKRHPPILLDIVEDGIILYDVNNFLSSIICEVRSRLEKLGSKRVKLERGWYWLLKPNAKFGEEITV